jgi:integrase
MFIAVLLAAMCGLRRGEIAALPWRSIDLERAQLSVVASLEQTEEGVREKETKSGRNRTVALPSIVVDELRDTGSDRPKVSCALGYGLGIPASASRWTSIRMSCPECRRMPRPVLTRRCRLPYRSEAKSDRVAKR